MKSQPKVSVIVPVYNVSQFLRKCLDSVVGQSLKEIEIILVNDASPDPLDEKICLEYKKQDSRIVYLKHAQNKGLGDARNTGIENAKGEYIGFVDSDDYIHKDMYKELYDDAIQGNYDFVECLPIRVQGSEEDKGEIIRRLTKKGAYQGENKKEKALLVKNFFLDNWPRLCAVNKLIKKSLLLENNIRFPSKVYYEDVSFSLEIIVASNSFLLTEDTFYYYRENLNSITGVRLTENHVKSKFILIDNLYYFLSKKDLIYEVKKTFFYFCVLTISGTFLLIDKPEIKQFFFKEIKNSPVFTKNKMLIIFFYIRIYLMKICLKISFIKPVYQFIKYKILWKLLKVGNF